MTKKLLLQGYYGFDNSGDDAILKAIVDNLKRLGKYEITALSKSPEKTKTSYDISAVDRFSLTKVMEAMKETDLFVFGGGSLLQDVTSSRSLFYYLFLIKLAKFYGKKVFVFANGIGPIDKGLNRYFTKKILNQVDYITLRDKASYSYVKYMGVDNPNIKVTADPVFLLDASDDSVADEILGKQGIKLSENVIGISVRNWKDAPDLTREIAKFADTLIGEDVDLLIVPMHYPYDVEYSETIKIISKNPRIHVLNTKYQVEDIIAILKKCKLVIAMRLHALIYSAKANVPILGLIYDPKVSGLIGELSVNEFIKVENVTAENLREKYDSLVDNLEERRGSIIAATKRQEAASLETIEELERLVETL